MDDLDRQLLNIIQTDFPVDPFPYRILGERLGVSGEDALGRVRRLVEGGVIRKVGPTFETRRLGHASVLVAAKVPPERLEEVAGIVSAFPEVTHNYGRDFEYNLWFTLVCPDMATLEQILEEIKARTGVADMNFLPAERMFKIKVSFEF